MLCKLAERRVSDFSTKENIECQRVCMNFIKALHSNITHTTKKSSIKAYMDAVQYFPLIINVKCVFFETI